MIASARNTHQTKLLLVVVDIVLSRSSLLSNFGVDAGGLAEINPDPTFHRISENDNGQRKGSSSREASINYPAPDQDASLQERLREGRGDSL